MENYDRNKARTWGAFHNDEQQQGPTSSGWQVGEPLRRRDPPNNLPRASQRKWNTKGRARQADAQDRQAVRLIEHCDNDAEARWRANQPPADSVRIPDELVLRDKTDAFGKYHETLARQHGTYIHSDHARGQGGSRSFGIWGEQDAVVATKGAIAHWIEESGYGSKKSARSAHFSKVVSLTPKLRERAERAWEREVRKQRFRRHPPMDVPFGAIGSFHWPMKEYRPEEILGASHEAFDPIRMDCSCYIVFIAALSLFRVMGKQTEVKASLQRIRQTCFQIAARQCNPVRLYLLHWPDAEQIPLFVYLKTYDAPATSSPELLKDATDTKSRKAPRGDGYGHHDKTLQDAQKQTRSSVERLRNTILATLARLHYYRGHVQMRIRLGTFLANQYMETQDGVYDLDEYESMLQMSQFTGEVTQELGDKATEQALLQALQKTTDLVTPSEATVHDLTSVKPVYAVAFVFSDSAGDYRLTVEWHKAYDETTDKTHFEIFSKKWTRLERDTSALTSLLDIALCDLSTSSAWQFDILASSQVIDEIKLSPQLLAFSLNLAIDPDAAAKTRRNETFVRFNPYANLTSFQQRTSYQYTLFNSDYTLELSRFQDRTYHSRDKGFPTTTVSEPRWSLTVYRKAWDAMLAGNERLPVGERADWLHDVATWFPQDIGPGSTEVDERRPGQGWMQLLEKLGRIEGIVGEVKEKIEEEEEEEDDLIGGMTVG
ncbi:hypothetical protein LTR02_014099 [Friedmanniomyces endolithicus]|nr:hypothetical protein LTR94_009841 [Friedmanniomyces endolithicus]KAK0781133.1 hypothetical protein LTR75_014801 [Friedmanniomyces endolithicus]KAK0789765.1 hypothetical protein LTR38_010824 [Friedmanniomyces endolithicus]KAK0810663.1 hypothetical protein LTR59_002174 [Friedmanniomyces endolithicus]KAK0869984.1 hypothetical protein LTS02_002759 [Friedmanniomyces endolithicus]